MNFNDPQRKNITSTSDELEPIDDKGARNGNEKIEALQSTVSRIIRCKFNKNMNGYYYYIIDRNTRNLLRVSPIIESCSVAYSLQEYIINKKEY